MAIAIYAALLPICSFILGVFGFFVGQVMKLSKGQANPAVLNELVVKKLDA